MQEELLQFKLQEVWTLVDLPNGKRAIGTKWVFKNKKDERGIVIRNKARLVAQGYTQEERIDYDEVFAPVARIEAIRLFLAYASFKDFVVYQMDVKSAFLYGKIEEEVYVCQPPGFEDPNFPDRVYKVEKALYGLHQALKACARNRQWLQIPQQKLNMWLLQVVVDKCFGFRINYLIIDKAVYKELDDSLVRATTICFKLKKQEAATWLKHHYDPYPKATPNEAGSQGTTSGGGPSGEDSLKLNELMELCTNLQQRVLDLETTKTTQANEIASLKRRVEKLGKKDRSRTHKLKRLYKVGLSARVESSGDDEDLGEDASKQGRRIHDIDVDEDITLVNDDNEIFDVDALAGEEVFVVEQSRNVVKEVVVVIDAASTILVSAATIIDVEITLAQALVELKSGKLKADKIEEPVVEQVKPIKRLEQMRLDEELAFKLQAEEEEEEEEEERLAREKA
ncbi:retrovirus-related pol polyprotein from transposon TNT 1-94 [Tanacetum coccineum]